jgi:hypothetical protein
MLIDRTTIEKKNTYMIICTLKTVEGEGVGVGG